MPTDEDRCPTCGVLTIDHTIRQLRQCHPTRDLTRPFEATERTDLPLEGQGALCGGVVVRALVLMAENPAAGGLPDKIPTLGFTFFGPDGVEVVAQVVLPADDNQLRELRRTVGQAVDRAILMAK